MADTKNPHVPRADLRRGCRGCAPPPSQDDLRLSNYHCAVASQLICFLSSSHVIALSKAFFFVFAFKICLHHQSVTPSLSGAPPPKKNPGSAPAYA